MFSLEHCFNNLIAYNEDLQPVSYNGGGLFLEESVPASFFSIVNRKKSLSVTVSLPSQRKRRRYIRGGRKGFLSVTMSSIKNGGEGSNEGPDEEYSTTSSFLEKVGEKSGESKNESGSKTVAFVEVVKEEKGRLHGGGTLNTAKHLRAGAVAAMVSDKIYKLSQNFTYSCCNVQYTPSKFFDGGFVRCYYCN